MTTQICIVSEQLIPNLIPALMMRPERVLLVCSAEMDGLGLPRRLRALLESEGFSVQVRTGLPSGALSRIVDYVRSLRDELRGTRPDEALVLNLTGGNKLMTIAFSQVLGPVAAKTIYTDTAHGLLEELPRPGEGGGASVPLDSVLSVRRYLHAQGLQVRALRSEQDAWRESVRSRRDVTRLLGRRAIALASFFGAVNRLANQAQDTRGERLIEPCQHFTQPPRGLWADALSQIRDAGLVRWQGSTEVQFADLEAARYLNGGWLEEYAWLVASELRPDDLALGVVGDWEGTERGRNELDVVIVHANRLLMIECKTLRLGRDDESDRDLLYKLDSVGDDVRGLFGEVVLLSARAPSPLIRDRAAHHGIQAVGPERLGRLQSDIRDWMEQGLFPSR